MLPLSAACRQCASRQSSLLAAATALGRRSAPLRSVHGRSWLLPLTSSPSLFRSTTSSACSSFSTEANAAGASIAHSRRASPLLGVQQSRPAALSCSLAHGISTDSRQRGRGLASSSASTDQEPSSPPHWLESHQPPLVVRTGLVGAVTALATPAFPVIFVNSFLLMWADPQTRLAITGGTTLAWFSFMVLFPKAFFYAPALLPFAIGNGMTAAGLYAVGDIRCGGAQNFVQSLPVPVGTAVGLATALLVPFTYPLCWALVHPTEEAMSVALHGETYDMIMQLCFTSTGYYVWPSLAMTGLVSGSILHAALKNVILGHPSFPWWQLAGGVLAASSLGLAALYSTSLRSGVLHLEEVDVEAEEFQGWFFPKRAPCYLRGAQEILWSPALDLRTGDIVSERFRHRELKDGSLELQTDGKREAGLNRAARARVLGRKAADKRVRCHISEKRAFFDDFYDPLDKGLVRTLVSVLPVGECVVTDLAVLMLAGQVPRDKLQESICELAPELRDSGLAARLRSSMNPFSASWASEVDPPKLLRDASVRAAELRELYRLENGAPAGPATAADLEASLTSAGVNLARARDSLRQLAWKPDSDLAARAKDWSLIKRQWRDDNARLAAGIALFGVAGTTVLLCGASTVR